MSTPKTAPTATKLPGGLDKIFQIAEELRTRNSDGYMQHVGGMLARIKNAPALDIPPQYAGTSCSPFTATVIGMAFDPKYPRDDLKGDAYVPMFNGGADELPFHDFYAKHNANDNAVKSLVEYGLGTEVDIKALRRGDLLEISWNPKGGGHLALCWDVHLNDKQEVDCFQILASNGPFPGVSIFGCYGPGLAGDNATLITEVKDVLNKKTNKTEKQTSFRRGVRGTLHKKGGDVFIQSEAIVRQGKWIGFPKVSKIDTATFRVPPNKDALLYANPAVFSLMALRAARFNYDEKPPAPFCMIDGPPPPPQKPGHVDTPAVVVKGPDIKKDPAAPQKVPAKPAKQEKDRPLDWQHYVEYSLRVFHDAKWIESDPGKSENINDAASQAALKEYQGKFKLEVDGIIGPHTLGSIAKQLAACTTQYNTQLLLGTLFRGKKLQHDPGPPDGRNNAKTRDAVEELQNAYGLEPTKVPDVDTLSKIVEVVNGHAATTEKAGLEPQVNHLYWVGNQVDVGGSATLRIHSKDLKVGQECPIKLEDIVSKKTVAATVTLKIASSEAEVSVPMPVDFVKGARVLAHVTAEIGDDGTLETTTPGPLAVGGGTETANWRPYIGKDEVPADVLDTIRRNRAQYPMKTFPPGLGKWAGDLHYDYKPGNAHKTWAEAWAKKKIDLADKGGSKAESHIAISFFGMLDAEGLPASFMTYDSQIITWGVGLGGLGDGKSAFTYLDRDAKMKKLLEDFGMNFDASTIDYHVVDLDKKKVVTSRPPTELEITKGDGRGADARHIVALEACRRQKDLMSALIGISEDPATRDAVMESQWSVYLQNSTKWPGQDKIFSYALFFMITHLHQWMPAIGKSGVHVEKEFAALGVDTPSKETDIKIAPRVALSFIAYAKVYKVLLEKKDPKKFFDFDDLRTRTKTKAWARLRSDAKKEGFDPGELTYED